MVLTALLIGFSGSLHCVGMCSPLAIVVSNLSPRSILTRTLYNLGRILTYSILGSLVGAFGAIAGLSRYESWLSVGLGATLLLFGVMGVTKLHVPLLTQVLYQFASRLRTFFGSIVKQGSFGSILILGAVNGLLPCGLTYLALAYCITLPNASQGFLFMFLFGLGTLPAMVGAQFVGKFISSRLPIRWQNTTVIVMILLGSLLIVRSAWVHVPVHGHHASEPTEVMCP